jgi:2-dehydropantoate 2-reductase
MEIKKVAIIGLDALSDAGKPSMRQDIEAKRPSEVALFSRMVVALGQKYGIKTPVNAMLYDKVVAIEKDYHQFSE